MQQSTSVIKITELLLNLTREKKEKQRNKREISNVRRRRTEMWGSFRECRYNGHMIFACVYSSVFVIVCNIRIEVKRRRRSE
jgi:hypothetical protein